MSIDIKIKEYISQKPIFPCFLTSNDNGEFESNLNCLTKIPLKKIIYRKEDDFKVLKVTSDENTRLVQNANISNDITCVFSEANYKIELKNIFKKERNSIYHIGRYRLYSFSVNEEDLVFNDKYINELNQISERDISDEDKALKIDDVFRRTGFFIPLKIYIGGIFSYENIKIEKETASEKNEKFSLDFQKGLLGNKNSLTYSAKDKNNGKNTYKSLKIIGGDIFKEDLDQWKKTVNLDNSNIIEYSNLISAKDILPLKLKNKLEIPLKLVEEKYTKRKKFFNKIHFLKEKQYNLIDQKDYGNFQEGELEVCQKRFEPEIYVEKIKFYAETTFFYWTTKIFERSFDDLIVGFKIIGNRENNYYNGEWTILNNPILSHDIKIKFVSQFYRVINFIIEVYLMKTPK